MTAIYLNESSKEQKHIHNIWTLALSLRINIFFAETTFCCDFLNMTVLTTTHYCTRHVLWTKFMCYQCWNSLSPKWTKNLGCTGDWYITVFCILYSFCLSLTFQSGKKSTIEQYEPELNFHLPMPSSCQLFGLPSWDIFPGFGLFEMNILCFQLFFEVFSHLHPPGFYWFMLTSNLVCNDTDCHQIASLTMVLPCAEILTQMYTN